MDKYIKFFKVFIGVTISIIIATFLWDIISLNYSNPNNVIGYYSELNLSPTNNLVRFIVFTSLPIFTYIILHKIVYKDNLTNFFLIIENNHPNVNKNNILIFFLYLFFLLSFLNFLSTDFIPIKVDYFHEGLSLSSGYNSKITGLFWSGSYISNSLFSEHIIPNLSWLISKKETIGSLRAFHDLLRFITEIIIIYFIYIICKLFNYNKEKEVIFFVIICLITLYLNRGLTETFYPNRYRDIPILLILILSFNNINSNYPKKLNSLAIGLLSCFSILWSVDRGIYVNAAILLLLFILLFKRNFLNITFLFCGILISWIFFYLYFDGLEVKNFLINAYSVLKDADLFLGIEYPKPFDFDFNKHASRGTKNLLIIIINGILIFNLILNKNTKVSLGSKLYLLFFFCIAYIVYKNGITRSDGYHMKQAIFFQNIILVSLLLNFLIEKIQYFSINKTKKYISFFLFIFLILISIKDLKIFNIFNFKNRYLNYVNIKDNEFLSDDYKFLKNKLINDYDFKCIQLFSYDAIIPFLLKKKFCTKYNFMYVITSDTVQKVFVEELKNKLPKYIIFNKNFKYIPLIPVEKRFKKVFNYINENYQIKEEILDWVIYVNDN